MDFETIKNKIGENSGLVNMVINLLILFWLITVGSGVKELNKKFDQMHHQTDSKEEVLKAQVIEMLIQQLNEVKQK